MNQCSAIEPLGRLHNLFAAWKSVPAFATGNVLIIKPFKKLPLGIVAQAASYKEDNLPSGVPKLQLNIGSTKFQARATSDVLR
jgi:acyl-CoA reductase-like NAD-dependent aldehyde dehydrogenase